MTEIFDFWDGLPGTTNVHPEDRQVLSRLDHDFDLNCLITPYRGPLRHARVVLLFLSPGLDERDKSHVSERGAAEYYARMRTGNSQLPSKHEHPSAWDWDKKILTQFVRDHEVVRSKVAILNICAYKSVKFNNWHMLTALPSSRVCLNWAQRELFPQAERGERVVVCLRSAKYWGLSKGKRVGHGLFAPVTIRNGLMQNDDLKQQTVEAVLKALDANECA